MTNIYRTHSSHVPTLPATWAELTIVRGEARNKRRRINVAAFLIGRADDCNLVLSDPQFPDVHACILLREGGVWLRHLGFMPEITVNGNVATRVRLAHGDRIRTGPYEFRVSIRGPARRETPDTFHSPDGMVGNFSVGTPDTADVEAMAIREVRRLLVAVREELLPDLANMRIYAEPSPQASEGRLPAGSIPIARPA